MESFSIRPLSEDDLPTIVQIERAVHIAPWNEEHFRAELDKPYSHTLVLTDDETDTKVVGYIVFWMMFDECQILNVVVDLPYRGLGYAKQLLRKVIGESSRKNLKRLTLDVRKGNLPAIHLYQGIGFSITQVRKKFYSNGEDAYQMTHILADDGIQF